MSTGVPDGCPISEKLTSEPVREQWSLRLNLNRDKYAAGSLRGEGSIVFRLSPFDSPSFTSDCAGMIVVAVE